MEVTTCDPSNSVEPQPISYTKLELAQVPSHDLQTYMVAIMNELGDMN
jgi:hypothetical protein